MLGESLAKLLQLSYGRILRLSLPNSIRFRLRRVRDVVPLKYGLVIVDILKKKSVHRARKVGQVNGYPGGRY